MQMWEGKLIAQKKETADAELKSQKSSEGSLDPIREPAIALCNVDIKLLEDAKEVREVPEVIANGAANAC